MKIGFDAKRAFQNDTGLGNYSRTLISSLVKDFPEDEYYLFAPKQTGMYDVSALPELKVVVPEKPLYRWFKSAWRSRFVVKDLLRYQVGIYHGLSHELPFGIHKSGIRSVVTMHDLIFERYPEQYNPIDVITYRRKARYACHQADRVVAISEQTKQDLITYYHTPADKIDVVYQSCDPSFAVTYPDDDIAAMGARYRLPSQYFLYVGSLIERKNLLGIVTAMNTLKGTLDLPLVVLGNGSGYKKKVKAYLAANGLTQQVIFLNEQVRLKNSELPLLYQGAVALLYPSFFEGFGIPILEALWSRTPVITSHGSCFAETAGDAALYVDPREPGSIADAMRQVIENPSLVKQMQEKGWQHAQRFTPEKCAAAMMKVYKQLNKKI
ncbi:Glycosyltransferase involved in cell wall bisynthesis [Chitinophaga ginsengisegetis]|uniref:Glycosyltransferase involved in cell wall bisynthesis n=1 Tax=Chitinophaga ginsengisegetis TaxID=393003 RepID=A0A1T5NFY5_9BACT|nr:glycosyltransferase family 1 protein [Chitinophaga ginsengisegetis]SKC98998.1 Glycosyltransferase involved in cell wall bisynthesis [Chitinophaga ginsengisegetis]